MIENKRVDSYDYLRAFAIIPVMLHHFFSEYSVGGRNGVSVFFCLSGFLITKSLMSYNKDNIGKSILSFLAKRFLRIYPPYVLSIFIILTFFYFSNPANFAIVKSSLPELLLMVRTRLPWAGYGMGVFWTLEVEAWFYVFIPFIYFFIKNSRLFILFCSALIPLSIVMILKNDFSWLPEPINYFVFIRLIVYSGNLLLGVLVASLIPRYFIIKSASLCKWIIPVCLLIISNIYFYADFSTMYKPYFLLSGLGTAFLTSIIISCISSFQYDIIRIPVLAFIGRISFSLYLSHGIVLDFFAHRFPRIQGDTLGNLGYFLKFFVICSIISTITYYLVEKPCIRLARNLSSYIQSEKFSFNLSNYLGWF